MRNNLCLCLLAALIGVGTADARPPRRAKVNTPAERHMDKNRDGWVQPREVHAAKPPGYHRPRAAVDRPWEAAADRDNDGLVDGAELRAYHFARLDADHDGRVTRAERRVYWHRYRIVDTAVERKYDANGDGYLEWPEIVELLKDKRALVATHGQAKVDTDLELEFDANGDGILDRSEAEALADALVETD